MKVFDTKRLRVRKLTPTEYGRLQAFPMDRWKQVVSDSQAYKQFGNAVTTTVFTPIAEKIAKAIYGAEEQMAEEGQEKQPEEKEESEEIVMGFMSIEDLSTEIAATLDNQGLIANVLCGQVKEAVTGILEELKGITIGEATEDNLEWPEAVEHLTTLMEEYAKIGPAGMFGIRIMTPLKVRYDNGERTKELYADIMATE